MNHPFLFHKILANQSVACSYVKGTILLFSWRSTRVTSEWRATKPFTRVVVLTFYVAHMYFRTTHLSLLRSIHCNNVFLTALLTIARVTYNKKNNKEEMRYMCKVINRGYYTVARRYEFYVRVARTISHSFAALTREILFLPREHKIHIF